MIIIIIIGLLKAIAIVKARRDIMEKAMRHKEKGEYRTLQKEYEDVQRNLDAVSKWAKNAKEKKDIAQVHIFSVPPLRIPQPLV